MQLSRFKINNTALEGELLDKVTTLTISSKPRDYKVTFPESKVPFQWLADRLKKEKHPLLLVDRNVKAKLLKDLDLKDIPTFEIDATEDNKDIMSVLKVCDFLLEKKANRGSALYVVGGGILQDLGAFAGYMFKRGIPWYFVPTTLLSQGDSCVGGKTAVNHRGTKNLLGLFSASREVMIDVTFAKTLSLMDQMSGCGEMYRLAITGGEKSLKVFEDNIDGFIKGDEASTKRLIASALSVKKIIVEVDEFELDIRRSMNYGHSVGHALEALSSYKIPHGIGVVIGILVENQISFQRNIFKKDQLDRLADLAIRFMPTEVWKGLAQYDPAQLLPYLTNDKKAEGAILKLATLKEIGDMVFLDFALDATGVEEVSKAYHVVRARVGA